MSLDKEKIIQTSWEMHDAIESAYLELSAAKGDEQWLDKQRILLADMAIHLLQTALKPDEIALDKLANNLHAILTITDQFLPDAKLKEATELLFKNS